MKWQLQEPVGARLFEDYWACSEMGPACSRAGRIQTIRSNNCRDKRLHNSCTHVADPRGAGSGNRSRRHRLRPVRFRLQ